MKCTRCGINNAYLHYSRATKSNGIERINVCGECCSILVQSFLDFNKVSFTEVFEWANRRMGSSEVNVNSNRNII